MCPDMQSEVGGYPTTGEIRDGRAKIEPRDHVLRNEPTQLLRTHKTGIHPMAPLARLFKIMNYVEE